MALDRRIVVATTITLIAIVVPTSIVLSKRGGTNDGHDGSGSAGPRSTAAPTPSPATTTTTTEWTTRAVVFGAADGDLAGGSPDALLTNSAVALSGNVASGDLTLAIGAPGAGVVRLLRSSSSSSSSSSWSFDVVDEVRSDDDDDDDAGASVALSADGRTLMFGRPGAGVVEVRRRRREDASGSSSSWERRSSVADAAPGAGFALAVSANGRVVAVGARDTGTDGARDGVARVFARDDDDAPWRRRGSDVVGDQDESADGRAVALSADGRVLAVGGPHRDGNDGRVRVLSYDDDDDDWSIVGNVLAAPASDALFGFSVDLSDAGDVLAVGARWYSDGDAGPRSGAVFVYRWSGDARAWTSDGVLSGGAALEQSGVSARLSGDGTVLAAGALGSRLGATSPRTGGNLVRVWRYDVDAKTWTEEATVPGAAAGDRFGESLALSTDGTVLAIGAAFAANDDGLVTGSVTVLERLRDY